MSNNIIFLMKVQRMNRKKLLEEMIKRGVKISRRTLYTRIENETEFKYSEIVALIDIFGVSFEKLFNIKTRL